MRILAAFLACFCLIALAGCSREVAPPAGRWEGAYDAGNTIVTARMEITDKGQIFVSAPNAENIASSSSDDRAAIRQRLAYDLVQGWDEVKPHQLDFDGKTFRKPGGIAPQMVWDKASNHLTLQLYIGSRPAMPVPLRPVDDFHDNPFASG